MLQWHIFQKRSTNAIHDGQATTISDTMKRRTRPKCTWSFALLSVFGPFAFMRITFAMPCPVLCWRYCSKYVIYISSNLTWVKWGMHKTIHVPFTTILSQFHHIPNRKKSGCHSNSFFLLLLLFFLSFVVCIEIESTFIDLWLKWIDSFIFPLLSAKSIIPIIESVSNHRQCGRDFFFFNIFLVQSHSSVPPFIEWRRTNSEQTVNIALEIILIIISRRLNT